MNTINKVIERMRSIDSMAGVGIDPVISRIPSTIWREVGSKDVAAAIELFCKKVIDVTSSCVVDYKINSSFFMTSEGRKALENTFTYLRDNYPEVVRICDGKFGDVEHTASEIASYVFDVLDADAVLINPYLGYDAVRPFVERADKAVVLCINTSNPSAREIQDVVTKDGIPLWRHVLKLAMTKWNFNGNIIPVVSATHISNLVGIREIIGDMPVVLAGIGSQGGSLREALPHVLTPDGYGAMISSSRGIIYPETKPGQDYWETVADKANKLRDDIRNLKRSA
ncbi:MAG: orotidine-5'-phosphate decarboxylase [bacterium]